VKVLFITWDGAEQNYLESLFLPIFERIHGADREFHVFQFTWASRPQVASIHAAAERSGMSYRAFRIWRRFVMPGTVASIFWGASY
jgi:hypothetical protein